MSSWFGDGLTSLKGQLTNLAKVLSEEPSQNTIKGESLPGTSQSDNIEDEGAKGESAAEGAGETASTGWTDVQLVPTVSHPSSEDERSKEERKSKEAAQGNDVKEPESSGPEHEKDVGSIIRGGIASLFHISRDHDDSVRDGHTVPQRDQQVQTEFNQDPVSPLVASLQERIDQLTQQNVSLSLTVANLGRAAAELEAQVAVSQDENANLSTGLEELDIQHQRAIESILVVRDETQKEYEILKVKYAELEEELQIAKDKELDRAKDKVGGKEAELIRELEERDRELDCLEEENASLRETLKEMMKEQEENNKETLATISEQDGEELEALERQVENLKDKLSQAVTLQKERDNKMDELTEQLKNLIQENHSLKSFEGQLMEANAGCQQEKGKNEKLKKKINELETKLTLLANAKDESELLIEHLQSQLDSSPLSPQQNKDLPSDIVAGMNNLEKLNQMLQSKITILESRLEELSNQKDNIQKECESKDRKMCQILLESSASEQECKKVVANQEIKYKELADEFNSCKSTYECDIKNKELEIERLNQRIEANNEIIVDNAMNTDLNEKLSLLEQENETLMSESLKFKLENEDLTEQVKLLDEQLQNGNKALFVAKDEAQVLKKQYEFDIRSMESKLNDVLMASQQYQIDKDVFIQKEIEFKNQLKLKDEEISAFKTFKQQSEMHLKEKITSIESEYKQAVQEMEDKLVSMRDIQTELNSSKLAVDNMTKSYEESLKAKNVQLEELTRNLDVALNDHKIASIELKELQEKFQSLSSEKSKFDSEQHDKEREAFLKKIESITEQNAQLLSDIVRLNAEHSAMKNQLVLSHDEQMKSLQQNLSSAQSSLKSMKDQYSIELESLKTSLAAVESERDELFKNIQLKHNECIGFQTEVVRLNDILKTDKQKMEALVVEKAQFEMKCEKFKSVELERDSSKKEVNELTQEVKKLKEQLDNASDLLKETKRTEAEGQSAEDTSSAKNFKCLEGCEKTQEEVSKLSWSLYNEQVNNKALQKQLADVNIMLEKSEVQLRRLQVHLLEVEQNQTEEQVEIREQMEQMKTKLETAEERMRHSSTAFTSANIRANQQVESLTHQVQMLTDSKEKLEAELSSAEDSVLKQQAAVTNLQAVLQQFQLDRQRDIEFETERIRQQLKESSESYDNLNTELKKSMDQINEMKKGLEAASRLSEQLDKKSHIIETLKSEVTVFKEKLEKEKTRVNEINSSVEGKVDKSLVKNLVIGYILAEDKSKGQVMRVLASVLELEPEERKKLALDPQSQKQQQTLSEAFIKFLENESQPKPQLVLSLPPTPDGSGSRRTSQSSSSSVLLSADPTSSLSHSPVIPPYPIRSNHSILKDLLKDNTPPGSSNPPS